MSPSSRAENENNNNNEQRVLMVGKPDNSFVDNSVTSSKYTFWSFLPLAIGEQFRRKGNVYFLVMGLLMLIGYYSSYFDSAISPWTTLGPLAIVVCISVAQEGVADLARHNSDRNTNQFLCTVVTRRTWSTSSEEAKKLQAKRDKRLRRSKRNKRYKLQDEFTESVPIYNKNFLYNNNKNQGTTKDGMNNNNSSKNEEEDDEAIIEFHSIKRQDILPGQLVLVRNRDMIPCDIVLLASSGDGGGAYIETSGIDGETNLKLRNTAKPPSSMAAACTVLASSNHNSRSSTGGGGGGGGLRTSFSADDPAIVNSDGTTTRDKETKNDKNMIATNTVEETKNAEDDDNDGITMNATESKNNDDEKQPMTPRRSSLKGSPKYSPSPQEKKNQSTTTPPSGSSSSEEEKAATGSSTMPSSISNVESLKDAMTRIVNWTVLGQPLGKSCLGLTPMEAPGNSGDNVKCNIRHPSIPPSPTRGSFRTKFLHMKSQGHGQFESLKQTFSSTFNINNNTSPADNNNHHHHHPNNNDNTTVKNTSKRSVVGEDGTTTTTSNSTEPYVAMITSELPNASVHTFSGKLSIPSFIDYKECIEIPLNADNFLLRGAFLRNTDWAIGVAVFTGKESKLVKNSSAAPSRLSQLDELVNRTILIIVGVMMTFVVALSIGALVINSWHFEWYWYLGIESNINQPWPYLSNLPNPEWKTSTNNLLQNLFLFTTLLNNFVPLSLYVTMEVVTRMLMTYINWDANMYHEETDTPANARSTTVTDLGQIKYIFSDKTGTLTQNVMNFKRCSVDGLLFGAPIVKSTPGANNNNNNNNNINEDNGGGGTTDNTGIPLDAFHPLKALLYGAGSNSKQQNNFNKSEKGGGTATLSSKSKKNVQQYLTFNAEMFLRVMSICHTVVVETDYDNLDDEDDSNNNNNNAASWLTSGMKNIVKKTSNIGGNTDESINKQSGTSISKNDGGKAGSTNGTGIDMTLKNDDGAPSGQSYQAESPDEGALVGAASTLYDFQFLGRDSNGIRIACNSPSILRVSQISNELKSGLLQPQTLASVSASTEWDQFLQNKISNSENNNNKQGINNRVNMETWEVLAVNKFDSTRKRMSVLVRSPPELGGILMLLCKGADSAMLDPEVCELEQQPDTSNDAEGDDNDNNNNDVNLSIQSHLGQFATEGLRTLVLAVRILPEEFGQEWLAKHSAAASSIKNRDDKLTQVAHDIERQLHIVGITAIEDKLQDGVPDAISKLAKAGIKLWVLTGDKRETAIEIGYSTKVLTPSMSLFQVSCDLLGEDSSSNTNTSGMKMPDRIRTIVASEFMRLVKNGSLPQYQNEVLKKKAEERCRFFKDLYDLIVFTWNYFWEWFWFFVCLPCRVKRSIFNADDVEDPDSEENNNDDDDKDTKEFEVNVVERRRAVREMAESLIKKYVQGKQSKTTKKNDVESPPPTTTEGGTNQSEEQQVLQELSFNDSPNVFERASVADDELRKRGGASGLQASLRSISIASETQSSIRLVDEDVLSLMSFRMDDKSSSVFSQRKRTLLEKTFAIDRDVRHGSLQKHLKPISEWPEPKDEPKSTAATTTNSKHDVVSSTQDKEKDEQSKTKRPPLVSPTKGEHTEEIEIIQETGSSAPPPSTTAKAEQPKSTTLDIVESSQHSRALIVEGSALAYFMSDPVLQEMLFAVASCCDAIIACRVSPKQKALLVRTVRTFVEPEPMTLAIGDGANDVGMIQEAHVGIGISGLEGQQAVNASDFSIAQFRFLEELLLIHGRWNFTRMARVVLFSFYKNAVLAGLLVTYCGENEFSGTSLFDEWVISMFNFICTIPILFVGLFDRDIPRQYVQAHPKLYAAGPANEEMSLRKVFRWVGVTLGHVFFIFFIGYNMLNGNSTMTSAWTGLMFNKSRDYPGDGEADQMTAGLAMYTILVFTLAYKALYETKSIIHGKCIPCIACGNQKDPGWDSCPSRLAWTWNGVTWGSIIYYIGAVYLYQYVALSGNPSYIQFIGVPSHTFETRSVVWLAVFLVPITSEAFDIMFKVFANMYFPTQTQIHSEICALQEEERVKRKRQNNQCPSCRCTLPHFQSAAVVYNEYHDE